MSIFKGDVFILTRSVGLFLCTLCVGFILTTSAKAAEVQLSPTQLNQVTTIFQQVQAGSITPETATTAVNQLTNGAVSPEAITNLANNVLGGGIDIGSAATMIQQVASGNINSGQILDAIGKLSGNPDIASITNALKGITNLEQMLKQATSPQQLAGLLGAVTGMVTGDNAAALANPAAAQELAKSLLEGLNLPPELQAFAEIALNILGIGSEAQQTGTATPTDTADTTDTSETTPGEGDFEKPERAPVKDPGQCGNTCGCCGECHEKIVANHKKIRAHVTDEFEKHRNWLVTTYFLENILPAMMLMTEQLTTIGMQQVQIIGSFLDAKHQLETQRLLQQMTAQAHKDYHPSEGLCEVGTNIRSLAASERRSDLGQIAFSNRVMQRQLLNGDGLAKEGPSSDRRSRLEHFITTYCDQADNDNGLKLLCTGGGAEAERRNKDVDYTRTVETKLTLDVDFTKDGPEKTEDEEDILALAANLYAHEVPPQIPRNLLADASGNLADGADDYMDLRAVAAKRSVAQNSFAAITAMKSAGSDDVQPFLYKLVQELGVPDDELEDLLGKEPSYFAQMEVLTKKIYQNPVFYTELYDKPVNVDRKGAALQAIGLMQDRDMYRSLLRSEAVLSVLLETMLMREQEKVANEIGQLKKQGEGP